MNHPRSSRRPRSTRRSSNNKPLQRGRHAAFETLETRSLLSAGVLKLNETLPTAGSPFSVSVPAGTAYFVSLNGSGWASGASLSFGATSSSSAVTPVIMPSTNKSLRLDVSHQKYASSTTDKTFSGAMEFQLFDNLAPATTAKIKDLVGDWTSTTQNSFYRVMGNSNSPPNGFMIQGGLGAMSDPVADINDEFNTDLRFTSKGLLAMANAGSGTNSLEFFVTSDATRWLDLRHPIFGFLTKGDSVREDVETVAVSGTSPLSAVTITDATIFSDSQNGVLMLKTLPTASGSVTVTVTVSDGQGGTTQQTFTVNIVADPSPNLPLSDVLNGAASSVYTTVDRSTSFFLVNYQSSDSTYNTRYGNTTTNPGYWTPYTIEYPTGSLGTDDANLAATMTSTGQVTVTPSNGLTGIHTITIQARPQGDTTWDTQELVVYVSPDPVTISLAAASGSPTGTYFNNAATRKLQFTVTGAKPGAVVTIYANGNPIGKSTVAADSTVLTDGVKRLPDGTYTFTADQTLNNAAIGVNTWAGSIALVSGGSGAIQVTIHATPQFTSTPATNQVLVGQTYHYLLSGNAPSGDAVTFALINPLTGMKIENNEFLWTPLPGQSGQKTVVIGVYDAAQNSATQPLVLHVLDIAGNPTVTLPDGAARTA